MTAITGRQVVRCQFGMRRRCRSVCIALLSARWIVKECPNCGSVNNVRSMCGCSWSEQLAAMKQKEQKRRKRLAEVGTPVKFDFIGSSK